MANPFLPLWEYIPDGEPRVFGDRVYIYGSHDKAGSDSFCDYKLKVWSASINDLNNWTCHGDIFHTMDDDDHKSDTSWTKKELYAPDVVEKDGEYYLYAYIVGSKGCVAKSAKPEGPFKLLSIYTIPNNSEEILEDGQFVDPGVLVDDDGRVFIYCGYLKSYMAEINAKNMFEILPSSFIDEIIPVDSPYKFFEACSPRKVGNVYYLIYSNTDCSKLVYATSNSPIGPFEYKGVIIDNGFNYPGGNNHGSICKIKDQWYIFYHRMTNNSIMSRRACVEKINLLEDGTIPEVEMTSCGFENCLSPYKNTPSDIACILIGGCYVTEKNVFNRYITNITNGCVIGYKYFDFGDDYSSKTMDIAVKIRGLGSRGIVKIKIDDYSTGDEIGTIDIGLDDEIIISKVQNITGIHSIYFIFEDNYIGNMKHYFNNRFICEFVEFQFMK